MKRIILLTMLLTLLIIVVVFCGCSKNNVVLDEPPIDIIGDNTFDYDNTVIEDSFTFGFDNVDSKCTLIDFNGSGDVTIPTTVQGIAIGRIGAGAFTDSSIDSLVIQLPTTIGFYAFENSTVKSVTIGNKDYVFDDVCALSSGSFYNCKSLKTFECYSKVDCIDTACFSGCESIETVVFKYYLDSIWDNAFKDCSSLKDIWLPGTVSLIADTAFEGCSKDLVFHGVNGSYCELWVKEHEFKWSGEDIA